ncbi:MAG: Holliday junction branch migration DNA helicase RuvB [Patescibacteria group bacterium]
MNERIITAKERSEDRTLDITLRPQSLKEYVGQQKIKDHLKIFVGAAKKRREPLEHVLLHGAPGLGKTTLAHVIANEIKSNIKVTSGPAIERAGDLAAILTNLQEGDILFIDEIHRLNRTIEEVLYPAMEEYRLDIVVGKGPSAQTLSLDLPRFTIIGATTRISLLSSPLRDRFGMTYRINFYSDDDICQIVDRSAGILGVELDQMARDIIATRARQTPRVANRLLKRVRDHAEVKSDGKVTQSIANDALAMLEIDHHGLDALDRKIIETIIDKFKGGPVGINTIAAALSEEIDTIADIYEPFLLQRGFLARTPRGRVVTDIGYKHLKRQPPATQQRFV